jgi:CHAD domain-containing protein
MEPDIAEVKAVNSSKMNGASRTPLALWVNIWFWLTQVAYLGSINRNNRGVQAKLGVDQGEVFLRSIFLTHLAELSRAHPLVVADNNPEGLHDFRVALRKLRSNLKSLGGFFKEKSASQEFVERLDWLDDLISKARDADVLSNTISQALADLRFPEDRTISQLRSVLNEQVLNARVRLEVGFKSKKTHDLLVDITEFLRTTALDTDLTADYQEQITKLNHKRSKRLAKKVLGLNLRNATNSQLHAIRIECKRLRYLAEASLPVLGKNEQKHIDALIKAQALLGLHNDLATAIKWTKTAAKKAEVKAGLRKHLIEQLSKTQESNDRRLRNKLGVYLG